MRYAMDETNRRRELQAEYNQEHNITPTTVKRAILEMTTYEDKAKANHGLTQLATKLEKIDIRDREQLLAMISDLRVQMREAADNLEFEKAAVLRDKARELQELHLGVG
jgi:excinuclease ABC subunit B